MILLSDSPYLCGDHRQPRLRFSVVQFGPFFRSESGPLHDHPKIDVDFRDRDEVQSASDVFSGFWVGNFSLARDR